MADRFDYILQRWKTPRPRSDFTPYAVVSRVLRAAHFLQSRLDRIAASYGLSHRGDLEVLTELELVGPLTPSELAETLLLTTGGMTVRLNRLQALSLVERQPHPRDGRGVLVRLTKEGHHLADDALPALLQAQSTSIESLAPTERKDLIGLLRTLLIGLGDTSPFVPTVVAQARRGMTDRARSRSSST
ncbi:MAG TPA: MarR family transcriptional regulator [Acidimicrobiia bacterium]|nr:MarR family transcriptional regulator [Acidimicrobiia bacterium]